MCVQVQEKEDTYKQTKLDAIFARARAAAKPAAAGGDVGDLEDFGEARPRQAGWV